MNSYGDNLDAFWELNKRYFPHVIKVMPYLLALDDLRLAWQNYVWNLVIPERYR